MVNLPILGKQPPCFDGCFIENFYMKKISTCKKSTLHCLRISSSWTSPWYGLRFLCVCSDCGRRITLPPLKFVRRKKKEEEEKRRKNSILTTRIESMRGLKRETDAAKKYGHNRFREIVARMAENRLKKLLGEKSIFGE